MRVTYISVKRRIHKPYRYIADEHHETERHNPRTHNKNTPKRANRHPHHVPNLQRSKMLVPMGPRTPTKTRNTAAHKQNKSERLPRPHEILERSENKSPQKRIHAQKPTQPAQENQTTVCSNNLPSRKFSPTLPFPLTHRPIHKNRRHRTMAQTHNKRRPRRKRQPKTTHNRRPRLLPLFQTTRNEHCVNPSTHSRPA